MVALAIQVVIVLQSLECIPRRYMSSWVDASSSPRPHHPAKPQPSGRCPECGSCQSELTSCFTVVLPVCLVATAMGALNTANALKAACKVERHSHGIRKGRLSETSYSGDHLLLRWRWPSPLLSRTHPDWPLPRCRHRLRSCVPRTPCSPSKHVSEHTTSPRLLHSPSPHSHPRQCIRVIADITCGPKALRDFVLMFERIPVRCYM